MPLLGRERRYHFACCHYLVPYYDDAVAMHLLIITFNSMLLAASLRLTRTPLLFIKLI